MLTQDWTLYDIYYASYSGYDYPFPEAYTTYQISEWGNVYNAYPYMVFKGAMSTSGYLDPDTAWIDVSNAVGGQYIPYNTYIEFA
jgi:hypothetical protein